MAGLIGKTLTSQSHINEQALEPLPPGALADRAVHLERQLALSNSARLEADQAVASVRESAVRVAALEAEEIAALQTENRDLMAENEALRSALENISQRHVASDIKASDLSEMAERIEVLRLQKAKLTRTVGKLAGLNSSALDDVLACRW